MGLFQLGYPVGVINARQGRNFAKAANQLAKTDAADAAMLAGLGEARKPPIRSFASAAQAELQDWVTRRRQLVDILTQNKIACQDYGATLRRRSPFGRVAGAHQATR
ncbi:hypothetical protein C7B65_08285 [Phormidesmis priestleyi ULC007]|uniref:Transposase IS110-like N-terminal domain-containing protein n=1 Tax=Phormidesmis priestleyi ULC007 TaxID=1920490 RepID=A0A2T1DJ12_9CYAN|nr:hypothetical protein C7B65_08285 [Phormidesmis priestleyi ULC007]PZO53000.1 MAG: hypothetical protein DCF14_05115 [Phormidesmis priestleyi]